MADKLVLYYSRAHENYVAGVLKMLPVGNTKVAAEMLAEITGADLFEVEQLHPYAEGYNDCIAQAQADQRQDARPALKAYPGDLSGYATIYLGYPNYWGTMPMAMFTLLEELDLAGKVIKPFCTHEGSGMGSSIADLQRLCPGATIATGLAIRGSAVASAKRQLEDWA